MSAAAGFLISRRVRRWYLPVAVLVTWQVAASTGHTDPHSLPAPSSVLETAWRLAREGSLFGDLRASLVRVGLGFTIAVVVGCSVGFIVASSRILHILFDRSLQALRLTPIVAAAPLFILWFGFGEQSKIAIVTAMGVFPMYLAASTAYRSVDPRLLEVTSVVTAGRWWRLRHFYIPETFPKILAGARFSLLIAWMSLPVAELIGTTRGIGHLAISGASNGYAEQVYVAALLFAIVGKGSDTVLHVLSKRALRWADTAQTNQQFSGIIPSASRSEEKTP